MVSMGTGLGLTSTPATESILSVLPPAKAGVGQPAHERGDHALDQMRGIWRLPGDNQRRGHGATCCGERGRWQCVARRRGEPAQVGGAEDAADDGDTQGASGLPGGVVDGLVMSAGTDADTTARPGNDSAREHTYRNSAAGH